MPDYLFCPQRQSQCVLPAILYISAAKHHCDQLDILVFVPHTQTCTCSLCDASLNASKTFNRQKSIGVVPDHRVLDKLNADIAIKRQLFTFKKGRSVHMGILIHESAHCEVCFALIRFTLYNLAHNSVLNRQRGKLCQLLRRAVIGLIRESVWVCVTGLLHVEFLAHEVHLFYERPKCARTIRATFFLLRKDRRFLLFLTPNQFREALCQGHRSIIT